MLGTVFYLGQTKDVDVLAQGLPRNTLETLVDLLELRRPDDAPDLRLDLLALFLHQLGITMARVRIVIQLEDLRLDEVGLRIGALYDIVKT